MRWAVETITIPQLHKRFRAQGVSGNKHIAFKCPLCGTVQSMASLAKVGVAADDLERYVGFSCIGRFTDAGPWKKGNKPGNGCDWTLGGLFKIHEIEVINEDGKAQPIFAIASSDEAQELERSLTNLRPRGEQPISKTEGRS